MDEHYRQFLSSCHDIYGGTNLISANNFFLALSDNELCWQLCLQALLDPNNLRDEVVLFLSATVFHRNIRQYFLKISLDSRTWLINVSIKSSSQ